MDHPARLSLHQRVTCSKMNQEIQKGFNVEPVTRVSVTLVLLEENNSGVLTEVELI